MLQPLLSPAHSDGRTGRAPERQDTPPAASFAATFRKASEASDGRSRPPSSDNAATESGNRLPPGDRPAEKQNTTGPQTDARANASTTPVGPKLVKPSAEPAAATDSDAEDAEGAKLIRLPEPIGDQLQLPVSDEVKAWLAGDGDASDIAGDDVLGQWLKDNPDQQSVLSEQLALLGPIQSEDLAVLVPVDELPEDMLAAVNTEILDPESLADWLKSTKIVVPAQNDEPLEPVGSDAELASVAAWLVGRAAETRGGNGIAFEPVTVPKGDWPVDHSLRAVSLPGEGKGAGIPAPMSMDTGSDKNDPPVTQTPLLKTADVEGGQKPAPDARPGEKLMALADALRQAPEAVDPSQRGLTGNDAAGRDSVLQRLSLTEQIRQHIERPLPANQGAAELTRQMGERVVMMIGQNLQEARMRLDPPDLGPMDIRIQTGQDQVQVQLSSQQPLVRDLLEQQAGRLRDLLSQQGFTDVDVDVSDQSGWSQAEGEAGDGRGGNGGGGDDDGSGESGDERRADSQTTVGLVDQYV